MKVRRQKNHRRILRFYRISYGIQEPYHVLVDGTFISHALHHKIHIREQLPKILSARATPMVTQCVMAELRALGKRAIGPAIIAKGYYRIQCGHEDNPLAAAECIRQQLGTRNSRRLLVATQDAELVKHIRSLTGVPLVRLNNQVPVLEEPSEASKAKAREQEENKSKPSEWERSKLPQLQATEAVAKAKAEAGPKKRKGPKGPNPLSCKKSKKGQAAASAPQPAEPAPPVKRQRSRKMGTRRGGDESAHATGIEASLMAPAGGTGQ